MKKLYRSEKDRKIAGVCGGLAEYFAIDPVIPRAIFCGLLLGAGSGLLFYFILWIVMPNESDVKTVTDESDTKK